MIGKLRHRPAAAGNGKPAQHRVGILSGDEIHHRAAVRVAGLAAVDDSGGNVAGIGIHQIMAGDGNGLTEKIDVLDISAVCHQHRIAIYSGVNTGLDGRLVCRNIDHIRKRKRENQHQ